MGGSVPVGCAGAWWAGEILSAHRVVHFCGSDCTNTVCGSVVLMCGSGSEYCNIHYDVGEGCVLRCLTLWNLYKVHALLRRFYFGGHYV